VQRLSKDDILRALSALAAALPNGPQVELWVVGGAAVVLLFDARDSTRDIDAFALDPEANRSLRATAETIAEQLELPPDWLNDGAKGYVRGLEPGTVLLETSTLLVRSVSIAQLLAMKLSAWRATTWMLRTPACCCRSSRARARRSGHGSSPTSCRAGSSKPAMLLTISGKATVELLDLVDALVAREALTARQWIADASRSGWDWSRVEQPRGLDPERLAVAAAVVELMAERHGRPAPGWTSAVPALPAPVFLVHAAERFPRLRRLCEEEGPEPLRRRRIMAPPDFLTAA
jgi:hypothetical protein